MLLLSYWINGCHHIYYSIWYVFNCFFFFFSLRFWSIWSFAVIIYSNFFLCAVPAPVIPPHKRHAPPSLCPSPRGGLQKSFVYSWNVPNNVNILIKSVSQVQTTESRVSILNLTGHFIHLFIFPSFFWIFFLQSFFISKRKLSFSGVFCIFILKVIQLLSVWE